MAFPLFQIFKKQNAMKRIMITINGKTFQCRMTLGAMMQFKELTGREVSEIKGDELSALATLLYCCAASGARTEGKDFPMSLQEFADNVSVEELSAWAATMGDGNGEGLAPDGTSTVAGGAKKKQ